ncbi:MAG: NAAT family transporter [Myxococcales bacterium]|nr:NAAT family transporter [Myxococcales bacterium]
MSRRASGRPSAARQTMLSQDDLDRGRGPCYERAMWSEVASFSLLCLTSVFFIVNPFSGTTLFITLTDGYSPKAKLKTARRAVLVAGAVLIVFAVTGNLVFRLFGVTLGAFRVAGGILLLRVAMDMLHGRASETKTTAQDIARAAEKEDVGVSPMAVPQLAGPGAIATVVLLPGAPRVWWRIIPVVASVVITLLITYLMFRGAERVRRYLTESGARLMKKIMGLLIAAVAVQFIAMGVGDLIPIVMERAAGGG